MYGVVISIMNNLGNRPNKHLMGALVYRLSILIVSSSQEINIETSM